MTRPTRPTRPTPPTCPECGASYDCRDTDAVFKDCDNWKCGSWKVVDSGCFHQSKQCQEDSLVIRVASLTRQLAEREEELTVVMADNAALLKSLNDVFAFLVHEDVQAEDEHRYKDSKFFYEKSNEVNEVIQQPHPGRPLLDKLSRLERVTDAARSVITVMDENFDDEGVSFFVLQKAIAALEEKGGAQ